MALEEVHIVSPSGLAKHTNAFISFNDARYAKSGSTPEGGTSDYNDLDNLPSIEGVEVKGAKTAHDYGLALGGISLEIVLACKAAYVVLGGVIVEL